MEIETTVPIIGNFVVANIINAVSSVPAINSVPALEHVEEVSDEK